jgi:hypothetical protein
MTNKEIKKNVESISERINELIFAFMKRDMSYQQAADEVLRRINQKRLLRDVINWHESSGEYHNKNNKCNRQLDKGDIRDKSIKIYTKFLC